ncbi:MAG: TonB-dependent receptor [Sphingomonadales bacterium]|nr:MAG: TonB-dependent receptor [Sphingomonadales bacterium]
MDKNFIVALLASACVAATGHSVAALAQEQGAPQAYDISPQPLGAALVEYARIAGREVIADADLVEGKTSGSARGRLAATTALSRLLAGTGLEAKVVDGALVLRPERAANSPSAAAAGTNADSAIIVTGTRIRGGGPVGSPVTTIDREQLDRSGRATLADFVQTIPQNYSGGPGEATVGTTARSNANTNLNFGAGINLRGLGSASTLTLFDGSRPPMAGAWGAFADLSLIPSTAVDRVEVLIDGASAIYGSDAVAGVVNIRFRNRFEGYETRLRAGTADGDFGEYQASQIVGFGWATGRLVVAGEYYRRDNLPATKRRFVSEDLRAFGGPDLRSSFATPGTIIAADGRVFAIPRGQDGSSLTSADLVEGQVNRADAQRLVDILPSQKSLSFYASAEQEVGPFTLFARGLYADRRYRVNQRRFGPVPVTVTSNNPYYVDPIGTGEPVTVLWDPSGDFGPEGGRGSVRALNLSGGARATAGSWNFEIVGGYGRQRERGDDVNIIHFTRRTEALASSDPSTALNVFGDGAVNDAALVDRLRGGFISRIRSSVWSVALRADGTLFELPAGAVKMAVGGEVRHERLDYQAVYDLFGTAPVVQQLPGLPGKRRVGALYGELVVPVFDAEDSFPGALQISVAGRIEDYSDVGKARNPKVGLRWTPLPGLALRASYGRSFRAPFFNELVGAGNATYQPVYLPDPMSPTGQTLALALLGFRPGLGPEKATSWTAGIDFEPRLIPGLRLSTTWFHIAYRDRIASASYDIFNFLERRDIYGELVDETPDLATIEAYFADPNLNNPLGVAAGDIQVIADGRTFNLSQVTLRGIDLDASYRQPVGHAIITVSLSGSRLLDIDQRVTASAPIVDVVGTLGNPVKLRLRGRLGFEAGPFDGGLSVQHSSGYRNATVMPAERVKSWTTFDLQLGARVAGNGEGRDVRLAFSVNNLFDRDPPYVQFRTASSVLGYDPEQASAIGRQFALQAIVRW